MAYGRKPKDIAGQRFGKLIALEYVGESKWRCRCDCGTEVFVRGTHLRRGITKSCGCIGKKNLALGRRHKEDLTGQVFGYLTVVEWVPEKRRWRCRCQCGKETFVFTTHLTSGRVKSCGCRPKDNPFMDLTGKRFDRLLVIKYIGNNSHGSRVWECLCDCGNTTYASAGQLNRKRKRSCGCLYERRKETPTRKKHLLPSTEGGWSSELEKALRECLTCCAICGITEEEHIARFNERLHIDHIRPFSLGHGLALNNAVLLCKSCNGKKGNRDLHELSDDVVNKIKIASRKFVLYYESLM